MEVVWQQVNIYTQDIAHVIENRMLRRNKMKLMTIFNNKGGVGKTTLALLMSFDSLIVVLLKLQAKLVERKE